MEIPPYRDIEMKHSEHDPLELNNKIQKHYQPVTMYSRDVVIKGEKRFITSIYRNDNMILRGIYVILGSFSKEKNVWIWGNRSMIMNKSMKNEISHLRSVLSDIVDDVKIKKFIDTDLTVIPTNELCDNLSYLSFILATNQSDGLKQETKQYNLFTISFFDIMDVLIIKKVLADNMKH